MKTINNKKQKELLNLIAANQIIFNAYNKLNSFEQIQSFSQFCQNSAEALYIIGGAKAVDEARELLFITNDNDNGKTN